ncbi:hypothetical protein C2S53_004306 [Perilla frutescens var. hirtella]|uniref:Uncharacterized protein n=1 Tax=Perilla frutescens var. hirtella TaxID=608512 RepID=A0AAD4IP25_PERFH|nr:hypothetical protein C2S53_004306 [Perilla frutescens var. hirtella]
MFNLIRKFKFSHGRFSRATSLPSATKFYFSSSAANAPETNSKDSNAEPFSAVYLKNEYGVSPKKALIYSKFLIFDSLEKPLSVVTFLKAHHFTESQITRVVQKWPLIFRCVPESSILPKIEFFRDLGFSSSEIVKILTLQPNLLVRNLEGQMIPCVDFLRSFLDSDKDVIFSILRYPGIFMEKLHHTLLPNVEILREAGVPESHIAALLRVAPRRIAVDPASFRSTVEEVLKLGFSHLRKNFITGLIVMRQLSSSSWKEKIEYYMRWGWSEQQVRDAIRKSPQIMSISKDKIAKILDFLINRMACDISVLTFKPGLMMLSFEETIAPRYAFYQVLLSKGLIKSSRLVPMLSCPQRLFFKRFVQCYVEKDPELLKLYKETFCKPKA